MMRTRWRDNVAAATGTVQYIARQRNVRQPREMTVRLCCCALCCLSLQYGAFHKRPACRRCGARLVMLRVEARLMRSAAAKRLIFDARNIRSAPLTPLRCRMPTRQQT